MTIITITTTSTSKATEKWRFKTLTTTLFSLSPLAHSFLPYLNLCSLFTFFQCVYVPVCHFHSHSCVLINNIHNLYFNIAHFSCSPFLLCLLFTLLLCFALFILLPVNFNMLFRLCLFSLGCFVLDFEKNCCFFWHFVIYLTATLH